MPSDQSKSVDFIVVGTGPGGATVARELSLKKKKVLILERGDNDPLTGSVFYGLRNLLWPGQSAFFTRQLLMLVRGITTGGSSVFYYATSCPIPLAMFRRHGIDLTAEAEEITRELPVGPLKDEMVGPMSRRLLTSAQDLGYNWQKLDKFMYQDRWKPGMPFGHFGDPFGVKWNARMYIQEALKNGAEIINRANVLRVIFEGREAVGIEYRRGKKVFQVFAPKIVLSAGGLGTPIILRASGLKRAGYDFFFDPLIAVRGTSKDIDVSLSEIPMSCGIHLPDEGYMMTDLVQPFLNSAYTAATALRPQNIVFHRRTLQIMIKVRDDLGGSLTDKGGVKKILGKGEKQKLNRGSERAVKILRKAGAKGIFKTGYMASHPGGTVKVGDLVDSNLKTEYDHLYVCDCSVIPEAWGL
ncbi:MAG TPA: GMC family oxidoreductase N-terminal domain-containing protein, partial [Thermodesulfobacteriota bacterium]|nr:GMC family oxidoreductase N-terminal domain-containing protein [Thermodesulfobacteriota bacterium]